MASVLHLPSIIGCAIWFAAAGCGIGSLVGTALGPWLYPQLPDGQGTMEERTLAMYCGTALGTGAGAVAGTVVGVLYAVLVRSSRLRRATSDAEQSYAPSDLNQT